MTAKKKAMKVEPGIYLLSDGRYRVRCSIKTGSTHSVPAYFDTRSEARLARARAEVVRAEGGDVIAALREQGGSVVNGSGQRSVFVPKAARVSAPPRTFAELVAKHQHKRSELERLSSSERRRSVSKGINTLRRSTWENDESLFQLHLLPTFGDTLLCDIDRDMVDLWLWKQADKGYATSYVGSQLCRLRAVMATAKTSERSEEYPWKGCDPIHPESPMHKESKPSAWGGHPGSADPILSFADMNLLAMGVRAAFRPAIYIEALAGLRIGEIFGLRIRDFSWRDGELWVSVKRQMDDQNQIVEWTKSDASYRDIPLPSILADYLIDYCRIYHGCDLLDPDAELEHRQLIVNPAGRATDGSFLPGLRSTLAASIGEVRDRIGLSHENLGYWVDSQHLRKSLSTYLFHAEEIIRSIEDQCPEQEPEDESEKIVFLRRQVATILLRRIAFSPADISGYLGHLYDGKGDRFAAAAVTLGFYNLTFESHKAFHSIAQTIDRIARYEIGELCVETDETDELPVHSANDAEWVTAERAANVIGIASSNVTVAVNAGRLDGHLGWLSDGGHTRDWAGGGSKPAVIRTFVSNTSIKEFIRVRSMPSTRDIGQLLGMSPEAVRRNFIATGVLAHEVTPSAIRVDPDAAAHLIDEIHEAILSCITPGRTLSTKELTRAYNLHHGSNFVEGRALDRWVRSWVEVLVEQGRLKWRGDRISLTEHSYQPDHRSHELFDSGKHDG